MNYKVCWETYPKSGDYVWVSGEDAKSGEEALKMVMDSKQPFYRLRFYVEEKKD